MKKVIASLTKGPNYTIAHNAARCPYFVVFNDDNYVDTIENKYTLGGGAGIAVAKMLKDIGCDLFIAGKIGDNMKELLEDYGIQYEEVNN